MDCWSTVVVFLFSGLFFRGRMPDLKIALSEGEHRLECRLLHRRRAEAKVLEPKQRAIGGPRAAGAVSSSPGRTRGPEADGTGEAAVAAKAKKPRHGSRACATITANHILRLPAFIENGTSRSGATSTIHRRPKF